jgi:hypothetical protein
MAPIHTGSGRPPGRIGLALTLHAAHSEDITGSAFARRRRWLRVLRSRLQGNGSAAMPHHRDNFLLNLLEPGLLDQIEPQLSIIDLNREQVLADTHGRIERVHFLHSGIISCVVELIGGGAIETGMIGKDGVFGASQALDDKVSLNHVVTQVAGKASLMTTDC